MDFERAAGDIVDAAVKIHMRLGPGLLESAYEACLVHELRKRAWGVKQQVPMPVRYDDLVLEIGYRLDLLVEDNIVVELKAAERILPVHAAQLLSYLRLGGYQLGFLLNFNTKYMKDGIKRVVNNYEVIPRLHEGSV